MLSPRLVAGLLATLMAFSACKDPSAPQEGLAPALADTLLAETTVGASYLVTLSASGGATPYTFYAQGLPPGLGLDAGTGQLTGSPTTAGDFPVQVSVKGPNGKESSKSFTLKVYPAVSFKQTELPAATIQQPYSAALELEGGKGPLTLKLVGGELPSGISFNASTGQLSGTAPASTGTASVNFEATDVHGAKAARSLTLQVAEALRVSTTLLGAAIEGVEYRLSDFESQKVSGPFGIGALTFAASGLPPGMSLDAATGALSGAPAVGSAGTYTLSFTVTDAGRRTVTQSFPLQVVKPTALSLGGTRGVAPTGGRLTDTLTVFTTNGRVPLSGVGVRVRKNGQEYSPPKEALSDAEGKVVFTGLGLNGNSDTVDITANGTELINSTLARVNASVVTLRLNSNPVFGPRVYGGGAYDPVSRRFLATGGHDSTNGTSLFYTVCHNDVIEALDVAAKSFRLLVPGGLSTSPSPRYDASMAVADGVAVYFGGRNCTDLGDALGDTWEFNLSTNTWSRSSASSSPWPRRAAAMVREPSGTSVLMVGGFRNPSYSNEMWRYEPATDTWTSLGTAPFNRAYMGAATNTATGELWFCGGRSPALTAECQAYNASTQAWTVKPSLPSARYELAMAFDPTTGNLYAFGGRASDSTPFGDLLVLRAGASSWESVIPPGAVPSPRFGHLMYFDLARSELVLAAGTTRDLVTLRTTRPNDVWTYNGTAWTERGTPAATAVSYTLSGQITGGPANGEAQVQLATVSGAGAFTQVTLDAQGRGTYTLSSIPPDLPALLVVSGMDYTLSYPNTLWTYTDAELAPFTANRTLDIGLPLGPAVLAQVTGSVTLPSTWRGATTTASSTAPLLEAGALPFLDNGVAFAEELPGAYSAHYVAPSAPRQQRLNFYFSNEAACEDHGVFKPITGNTVNVTLGNNVTGMSPGRAECIPTGSSGVGQARMRLAAPSAERIAVGDIDGDNLPDIVNLRHTTSGLGVSWGTPTLTAAFVETFSDVDQPHSAALGDFNEDGKLDLAITEPQTNQVKIKLSGTAARTFDAAVAYPAGTGAASIATADVSNDGNLDLLVANPATHTVSLLLGVGNGTFSAPQTLSLAGTSPKSIVVANVDGDTSLDMAVVVAEGISVSLDGFAQGPFATPTLLTAGSQPSAVVVGRLNADTLPDLMVTNEGSSTLSLLLGAGGGTFAGQVNLPTGTAPSGLALAELTGDTHLDLAVTSPVDGIVILYRGSSNGTFTEHSRVPVSGTLRSLVAADLNGDSYNDLAVASQSANSVYLLLGQRPAPAAASSTFSFTAPAGSGYMQAFHGVQGYRRYWDYASPIGPGAVSYTLPLPSTLAPSSAPVAPASGQLTLMWTPWVRKWEPSASRPFNARHFYMSNLGADADTQPGAHQYLWP